MFTKGCNGSVSARRGIDDGRLLGATRPVGTTAAGATTNAAARPLVAASNLSRANGRGEPHGYGLGDAPLAGMPPWTPTTSMRRIVPAI
jgi:hypothetical protein